MDLVDGGDLRQYLRTHGPIPADDAAALIAAITEGLTAIHARGIVHRDIKPENILLDRVDGTVTPKITDFGISRIAQTGRTSTVFTGTPTYTALELFDDRPPTPASDVYALGIVYYEMLVGHAPFGRTPSPQS